MGGEASIQVFSRVLALARPTREKYPSIVQSEPQTLTVQYHVRQFLQIIRPIATHCYPLRNQVHPQWGKDPGQVSMNASGGRKNKLLKISTIRKSLARR